jgi:hypothetical protein
MLDYSTTYVGQNAERLKAFLEKNKGENRSTGPSIIKDETDKVDRHKKFL